MRADSKWARTRLASAVALTAYASAAIADMGISAPQQAMDLTNRRFQLPASVDIYGVPRSSFWFSVSAPCRIVVEHPRDTGFKVRYRVETVNGSRVMGSLMGTNPKPRTAMIGPGRYKFVVEAIRETGFYPFAVATYCN